MEWRMHRGFGMNDKDLARPVSEIATPGMVTVRRDLSLQHLKALFAESGLERAVVVDDAGRPIGVVSQSDLVAKEDSAGEPKVVLSVMSPGVVGVPGKATIAEACEVMARNALHGIAVFSPTGDGWLSATDVVRYVAQRGASAGFCGRMP